MYNSKTFEYRQIDSEDYRFYRENAQLLLDTISLELCIPVIELTYNEIIEYFVDTFDIEIVFFDSSDSIKNRYSSFEPIAVLEVSDTYLKRVSGFTMTDGKSYKIFLQQFKTNERIIFTLLHELVHIFFHCRKTAYMQIFASLQSDEDYPPEIIPFEDEANVVASILYLNDEKLADYLEESCSFDMILTRHNISKSALHNRLNNYLIYNIGLNPPTAFFQYLRPYKNEVYGTQAIEKIQYLLNVPKNFLQFIRT